MRRRNERAKQLDDGAVPPAQNAPSAVGHSEGGSRFRSVPRCARSFPQCVCILGRTVDCLDY